MGRAVCARDDQVDALNDSMFRILNHSHGRKDPHTIGAAMELFLVRVATWSGSRISRPTSRKDVVFLVEGKTIKHPRRGPREGRAPEPEL